MDAYLRDIKNRTKQLSWGVVTAVGDGVVEALLSPSDQTVTADIPFPVSGPGGGIVRLPTIGDALLVGMIDGNPNDSVVLNWYHSDEDGPEYLEGISIIAATEESILIEAGGLSIEISIDGKLKVSAGTTSLLDEIKKEVDETLSLLNKSPDTDIAALVVAEAAYQAAKIANTPPTVPATTAEEAAKAARDSAFQKVAIPFFVAFPVTKVALKAISDAIGGISF